MWLIAQVILAAAGSRQALQRLAAFDYRAVREGLEFPPPTDEELKNNQAHVKHRVALLRRRLGISFFSMSSACVLAWLSSRMPLVLLTSAQLGAMSAFIFAWAGLSRLGWAGQSIRGNTSVERVDSALFHALCWIGMYLAAATMV